MEPSPDVDPFSHQKLKFSWGQKIATYGGELQREVHGMDHHHGSQGIVVGKGRWKIRSFYSWYDRSGTDCSIKESGTNCGRRSLGVTLM